VAVFGCGGVGLNAIQGARLVGAYPIVAVDVESWKLDLAERLGATSVIDSSREDLSKALTKACPAGIDTAIVTVGRADVIAHAWASLAPGGACVIVGRLPSGASLSIDPERLYGKENRLLGSRYGSSRPFDDFPKLVELYMGGRLLLDELVTHRYPLDDANEAHRALAAGELARGLLIP
jgi:S-(hydroxymethyl)glutathione dehydrogenase/alcohol dehydrogenase